MGQRERAKMGKGGTTDYPDGADGVRPSDARRSRFRGALGFGAGRAEAGVVSATWLEATGQ